MFKPCVGVRSSQRRGAGLQMWSWAAVSECCKRGQPPGRCTNFFSYHSGRNVGAGRGKPLRQTYHNKRRKKNMNSFKIRYSLIIEVLLAKTQSKKQ